MKYSEFREYLKSNDFGMRENDEMIIADDQFEISKRVQCSIWFLMDFIEYPYEFDLIKKAIELAETPLNERGEVKKYYLKHKFINNYNSLEYINILTTKEIVLNDHHEDPHYKTKFTKAEIEELKVEFETNFNDFEFIEVEED